MNVDNKIYAQLFNQLLKKLSGSVLLLSLLIAGCTSSGTNTVIVYDTTAPTLISSNPADTATNVAINTKIMASFNEPMKPLSLTTSTMTVTGPGSTPVLGTVTLDTTKQSVIFVPTTDLTADTLFTVTVTTGVEDLAGNALATDHVWSFTTNATPDIISPTVTSINPTDAATNVAVNHSINASFSKAIDPLTITSSSFTVTGPEMASVAGAISYDSTNNIASFTPTSNLASNTLFTVTLTANVEDLAGNALDSDVVWTFTTGAEAAQTSVALRSASNFAVLAGSAVTNTGATSQVNGDVGVSPSGTVNGLLPAQVNGTIYTADPTAAQAKLDLTAAFLDAQGRSTNSQTLPGNLGGLTFTPGLYTNSTSVLISGSGPGNNVTLDAQGDANAVFVFQMGSTLTASPGSQVILSGGAKAANVYWEVGTSATLDTTVIFKGNLLAQTSITINTGTTLEGRALTQNGAVTLDTAIITVPSP